MKNFFVFLFACCAQAVSAHIAFFCATCANAPSGTNIENIKKTVFMVFSYMIGEFLYLLFIIMSINLHGGLTAVPLKIGKSAQGYVFY